MIKFSLSLLSICMIVTHAVASIESESVLFHMPNEAGHPGEVIAGFSVSNTSDIDSVRIYLGGLETIPSEITTGQYRSTIRTERSDFLNREYDVRFEAIYSDGRVENSILPVTIDRPDVVSAPNTFNISYEFTPLIDNFTSVNYGIKLVFSATDTISTITADQMWVNGEAFPISATSHANRWYVIFDYEDYPYGEIPVTVELSDSGNNSGRLETSFSRAGEALVVEKAVQIDRDTDEMTLSLGSGHDTVGERIVKYEINVDGALTVEHYGASFDGLVDLSSATGIRYDIEIIGYNQDDVSNTITRKYYRSDTESPHVIDFAADIIDTNVKWTLSYNQDNTLSAVDFNGNPVAIPLVPYIYQYEYNYRNRIKHGDLSGRSKVFLVGDVILVRTGSHTLKTYNLSTQEITTITESMHDINFSGGLVSGLTENGYMLADGFVVNVKKRDLAFEVIPLSNPDNKTTILTNDIFGTDWPAVENYKLVDNGLLCIAIDRFEDRYLVLITLEGDSEISHSTARIPYAGVYNTYNLALHDLLSFGVTDNYLYSISYVQNAEFGSRNGVWFAYRPINENSDVLHVQLIDDPDIYRFFGWVSLNETVKISESGNGIATLINFEGHYNTTYIFSDSTLLRKSTDFAFPVTKLYGITDDEVLWLELNDEIYEVRSPSDYTVQSTVPAEFEEHEGSGTLIVYQGTTFEVVDHSIVAQSDLNLITYTVSINTVPANSGDVAGGGEYQSGSNALVSATAKDGFVFKCWSNNVTTAAQYVSVVQDISLTATFVPDTGDDDGDGLTNYQEAVVYQTLLDDPDTDGDELADGFEVAAGLDPKTNNVALVQALRSFYPDAMDLISAGSQPGGLLISPLFIHPQNDQLKLKFEIHESDDLLNWSIVDEFEATMDRTGNLQFYKVHLSKPTAN